MATIEKKFSDFQETECKPEISEEILESNKICPTCQTNPYWVLPASHWTDITEAYLNEKVCEYRVMVLENDRAVFFERGTGDGDGDLQEAIIAVGVERIILFTDKKLSNASTEELKKAAFIADTTQTVYNGESGLAYLISVPAFNVDTLENDPSKEENDLPSNDINVKEILLKTNGLRRKIRFLRLGLLTFSNFYSMLQKSSDGFTIREEQNEVNRISYRGTAEKISQFVNSLNDALKGSKYPKLGGFAPFHSDQLKSLKFIFKEGDVPYLLDSIYVLSRYSCNEYVKLSIPQESALFNYDMQPIYHFLNNIEKIYKDLTAVETKPWLEFTLENFYPTYVVDYGNVIDTKEIKPGLACLLESQLGIGNGKVVDALASEIVSAFAGFEEELQKQACRSLTEAASGGGTALSEEKNNPSPSEQRKLVMLDRYKNEFERKWYKTMSERFNKFFDLGEELEQNYTDAEIRRLVLKHESDVDTSISLKIKVNKPGDYTDGNDPTIYVAGSVPGQPPNNPTIRTAKDLEHHATRFANRKFKFKEEGNFSDQIGNSPHFQEALDASKEVLAKFDNTYIDVLKDTYNNRKENFSMENIISVLGVCGMGKIAGKAFECLAGGISFDAFMESLVQKIFEFMDVATLDLFFNALPVTFRDELESTIKEQLGSNIDFVTLLEIKKTQNSAEKMVDFVKSMAEGKRLREMFETHVDPRTSPKVSADDKAFLISKLGEKEETYNNILTAIAAANYSRKEKSYPDKVSLPKPKSWPGNPVDLEDEYKERKAKKWVLRVIKNQARLHKKDTRDFKASLKRIGSALGDTYNQITDPIVDSFAKPGLEKTISELVDQLAEIRRAEIIFGGNFDDAITDLEQQLANLSPAATSNRPGEQRYSAEQAAEATRITEEINQLKDLSVVQEVLETELSKSRAELDGLNTVGDIVADAADPFLVSNTSPSELNQFESAVESFKYTRVGTKVDIVFDVIFDFVIDSIMESLSLDDLLKQLRSYPIVDFALDKVMDLLIDPCPTAPIIHPPPSDFLKSLTFDICDGTAQLTMPQIIMPNIDFRFKLEYEFNEIFREAIIKVVSDIIVKILIKLLKTLEGALCKLAESAGNFISDALKDGLPSTFGGVYNGFLDALNEAFCNDGVNPDTANSRASELADALFDSVSFNPNEDFTNAGDKAANVMSSVASQNEFLEALVASEGEGNDQFYTRISNAIKTLAPEMISLLGSPNQVAYFFRNLGSYLSPDDRERIRNLLDAGIPNLPVSPALCLTNDQLNDWNDLRESILSGENPAEAVDKLNNATEEAFEDILDTIGDIETDGPFIGSLTNEAAKDVCNPNNVFNDVSQSDFDKQVESDQIDDFYNNISKILKFGFFGRGGLLGEALRDTLDRREFARSFQKAIRMNYANTTEERMIKYESKARKSGVGKSFGQKLMDAIDWDAEEGAPGVYPETVGLLQREKILSDDGIVHNFSSKRSGFKSSKNINFIFKDDEDDSTFIRKVSCSTIKDSNNSFNYNVQILEKIDSTPEISEMNINIRKPVPDDINEYMIENGFRYNKNSKPDIRKELFSSLLSSKIPGLKYDLLYENTLRSFTKSLCEGLLTDYTNSPTLYSKGYMFGYKTNPLSKESYEYLRPDKSAPYDLEESEATLGKFADDRIIALDPKKYGGRYSNPPYYVEKQKYTGWYELATKAFDSEEGCDPKTPPVLNFQDISDSTKNLSTSLRNRPELSDPEECRRITPFNLLLDSKNKARLDGVVRATLRTYLSEFFIQGYGLFSNINMKGENFDDLFFAYVTERIKRQMMDLGGFASNKKIRIVRERYWYTFLEQVVEAYLNGQEVGTINPPEEILQVLDFIQSGCDLYQQITKGNKKYIRKQVKEKTYYRPKRNFNPIAEVAKGVDHMAVMALAYRLSDEEERENFMDGGLEERITSSTVYFASVKKMQFFQKIFFIKLFENQALRIMREFLKIEFKRMAAVISDGPLDKPYYDNLLKSMFGMQSIFVNSSSRVGLSLYELEKLTSQEDPGMVPDIKENNTSSGLEQSDKVRFLIHKYIKIEDKESEDIPAFIANRSERFKNYASIKSFQQFVDENSAQLENEYLSTFFGDLRFLYRAKISNILSKGFTSVEDLERIVSLNSDAGITLESLIDIKNKHQMDIQYENISIFIDDYFVTEGESYEPQKTIGSTGVKFGLRVSIVLPENLTSFHYPQLETNSSMISKSAITNSYLFSDGIIQIPVVETEVDVLDKQFKDFNPYAEFDLECLINKMVSSTEFLTFFDYAIDIRQISSLLAVYVVETLPASIGRHPDERDKPIGDIEADDWDRTVNKFAKNFLRREFKSIYLSRTPDASDDDDNNDFSLPNLFQLNNPFDGFSFPGGVPWWVKRRMKVRISDKNGVECVDPQKDLQ